MSGGFAGQVMEFVTLAANVARDDGTEHVYLEFFQALEWLPP